MSLQGPRWRGGRWDIDVLQTPSLDIHSILGVWQISPSRILLAGRQFLGLLRRYHGGRELWGGSVLDIDLPLPPRRNIHSILSVWGISPSQVLLAGMEVQGLLW